MYTAEQWHIIEKENSRKSAITTSILMLILFLLLYFWVLNWPREKDMPLAGMMIDFGTTETGQGDNSPAPAPNSNEEEEVEITEAATADAVQKETPVMPEKVATQNTVKAPAVAQKTAQQIKAEKAAAEAKKKAEAKAKAQAEADALKNELNNVWGKGNGDGNDGKPGDAGDPNGVNNGGDGSGTGGSGDGLEGMGTRKWEKKPEIENKSNNYGRVVLKIKVDKQGNIISAEFASKSNTTSSTTTNSYLVNLAKKEVMRQGKLTPDPKAQSEQWGYYIFNFKAK
jgi:outer membrane biosynthesis protein TonB